MTRQELIALCEKFKLGDNESFRKIIAGFVALKPDNKDKLCAEFSASVITVDRWKNGYDRPHVLMQGPVVDFIKDTLVEIITKTRP